MFCIIVRGHWCNGVRQSAYKECPNVTKIQAKFIPIVASHKTKQRTNKSIIKSEIKYNLLFGIWNFFLNDDLTYGYELSITSITSAF